MGRRLKQQNTVEALDGKKKASSLSSPESDEMRRPTVLMKSTAELCIDHSFIHSFIHSDF